MVQPREREKPEGEEDDDENTAIPAGYTYLGQFIDHDLTFDPASSLQRQNDPDALRRLPHAALRPRLVYGRGPADQPYLYDDADGPHCAAAELLLGQPSPSPATRGPDRRTTCRADAGSVPR